MVHAETDRQTHQNAAEQIGDDLPGLPRRPLSRQLVRDAALRAALQCVSLLVEAFDRLFARFR